MKKKKVIPIVVVVCIVLIALFGFLFWPKEQAVKAIPVEQGSISTYYTASGVADAAIAETVASQSTTKVYGVYVEEGEWVDEGDSLLSTDDGIYYYAGVNGTVVGLTLSKGSSLVAGQEVLSVIDRDSFQVVLQVDEYDVNALAIGKNASITLNALGTMTQGYVSNASQKATQSGGISYFNVTIALPYVEGLKEGMSLEVKILKQQVDNAVLVTVDALRFDDDNSPYVVVLKDDGKTETRRIILGIENGRQAHVIEGLSVGEQVVIVNDSLSSGSSFSAGQGMQGSQATGMARSSTSS